MAANQPKKAHKGLWIALLVVSLALVGAGTGVLLWIYRPAQSPEELYTRPAATAPETESHLPELTTESAPVTTQALPDNPIDFAALQQQNKDVYAWIEVPGTDIALPVLQPFGPDDDNFYLHHDLDRNYDFKGCIYTQKANAKDFSDPVTVVYGHNMLDGTMFTNLQYFRDKEFFDQHDTFYIYTPGHILTYQIVSAHQYDTRHILNSFDFSKPEVLQEYIDYFMATKPGISAVREGAVVTTEDHIVTLSTCLNHGETRYLIHGVLTNDQPTN